MRRNEVERTHVGRLFLYPQELACVAVLRDCLFQIFLRHRKHPFQKENCGDGVATALAFAAQLMPNLAGTEDEALAVCYFRILNYGLESAISQITQWAGCIWMAQHALGS